MPHMLKHNHAFGITNDIIKNLGSMNKGKKDGNREDRPLS
jgi:hypothetical protein